MLPASATVLNSPRGSGQRVCGAGFRATAADADTEQGTRGEAGGPGAEGRRPRSEDPGHHSGYPRTDGPAAETAAKTDRFPVGNGAVSGPPHAQVIVTVRLSTSCSC